MRYTGLAAWQRIFSRSTSFRLAGFSSRSTGAHQLRLRALSIDSEVVAHRLGCTTACGIFTGIEPMSSALEGRFLSTAPPGSPRLGLNGKHISVEDPGQSRQTMSKVCSDYCSVLPFSTLLFSTLLSQYCQIVHFLPHSWSVVFPTSAF